MTATSSSAAVGSKLPGKDTGWLLAHVTYDDLLPIFMAPSWPRPADEAEVGLVHGATFRTSPQTEVRRGERSMKIWHLCYAALGIAVARWVFKRQPMAVTDPIARLRTSGLL
jgi:hypothetical protein